MMFYPRKINKFGSRKYFTSNDNNNNNKNNFIRIMIMTIFTYFSYKKAASKL